MTDPSASAAIAAHRARRWLTRGVLAAVALWAVLIAWVVADEEIQRRSRPAPPTP